MNIKGTSVKATDDFVRKNFSQKYDIWLNSLPRKSKEIFTNPIFLTNWYPFDAGLKYPTEVLASIFYENNIEEASYNLGKYSAEVGLKGVYKAFIKITSPQFVLKRLPSIYSTYYDFGHAENLDIGKKNGVYRIYGIDKSAKLLFSRIQGWTEQTLQAIKKHPIKTTYTIKESFDGTLEAIFNVTWE